MDEVDGTSETAEVVVILGANNDGMMEDEKETEIGERSHASLFSNFDDVTTAQAPSQASKLETTPRVSVKSPV